MTETNSFELRSKKILLISPEGWGDSFVSKHHYAQELSRLGNHVFFLNPPSNKRGSTQINEALTVVDYIPTFRGLARVPKFLSAYLTKYELRKLERYADTYFDIIWNFDSSRFFNLAMINTKLKICHIVDMSENFQRDLLASTSNICLATSDFIKETLLPQNKKVYKIHHGYQSTEVDFEDLTHDKNDRIQVGYVGNLARACIDWKSLQSIIASHEELRFNFIGGYLPSNLSKKPIDADVLDFLQKSSNVILHGPKPSSEIPYYLSKYDLLICAYKLENADDLKQHSNLHKVMEYIASGNASVTNYIDEYKDKEGLLEMTEPFGDFVLKFEESLKNIEALNAPKNKSRRKAFVLNHTYGKQIEKIEKIIQEI